MSEHEKFDFGKPFQCSILKLMLKDSHFCYKCSAYLKPTYFSDIYLGWFFGFMSSHYMKYQVLPDIEVIMNEIQIKIADEEKKNYRKLLEEIVDASIQNIQYIKDQLMHFIKANLFKAMHYESRELYNSGDYDKAYEVTSNHIEDIMKVEFDGDGSIKASEIDNILAHLRNSMANKVPLGIPILDEYLIGGLPKQTVSTIMAGYNSYKTAFSINCAYHAAMAGTKVLFAFCEGREHQIVTRFLSRITGIPYRVLNVQIPDAEQQKKIDEAKAFIDANIIIKKARKVGQTIEDIYEYAKERIKTTPFGLLIIDSAHKLNPRKRYTEKRHNLAAVWNTLDSMSDELGIAILVSTQMNREGHKASNREHKIVRSENVAECIDIAQTSETIITLNPFGEDRMIVCLDKQRDGKAGVLVDIEMNLRCATTHDKSMSMKETTFEELDSQEVGN